MKNEKTKKQEQLYHFFDKLDASGLVALHYGFRPIETPTISKQDIASCKALKQFDYVENCNCSTATLPLHVEEKAAILRTYFEQLSEVEHPCMVYLKSPTKGGKDSQRLCELEIIGSEKAISEALLIQTSMAILREEGFDNLHVEVNSVGNKDAIQQFNKEIAIYAKKHANSLPTDLQQLVKDYPASILNLPDNPFAEMKEYAPKPSAYLDEPSRMHFQELLDYLEVMDIPFTISHGLIGNQRYCRETLYEIIHTKETGERVTCAVGVRYNNLSKLLGFKKDVPVCGVSLLHQRSKMTEVKNVKVKKPRFIFAHIGPEAKSKSLALIELLRQNHISVYHSLIKDKLGTQLTTEKPPMGVSHVILMGKLEAVCNAVIVREIATRKQDTVSVPHLITYLKGLQLMGVMVISSNLWLLM